MTPKQWNEFLEYREFVGNKIVTGKRYLKAQKMLEKLMDSDIQSSSDNKHILTRINLLRDFINSELSGVPDRTIEAALDYFSSKSKE